MAKQIVTTRSEMAERLLYLEGSPLSLKDYPHMVQVYNTNAEQLCLHTSRQVAKSTTLATLATINSVSIPYFKTMYVAPRKDQTTLFSRDRLGPIMLSSPLIKKYFIDPKHDQNVFFRQFNNGSKIYLRYAYHNADSLRGFTTDANFFDEVQSLVKEVIPIANQTMTHSLYKKEIYSGTPLRTQGTLASIWNASTQNEWAVKCGHCNHWNVPIDDSNIGETTLICKRCAKPIDPRNGQWVSTGDAHSRMVGFRVCAPMFLHAPWVDWERDIIQYRKNHGEATFFNEVMGMPYDDGVSPITKRDLQNACNPGQKMDYMSKTHDRRCMGVDYGPVNSTESYTYMALGRWAGPDVFQFEYFKKYTGKEADPSSYHNDIAEKYIKSGAVRIGADYGMGEASNSEIRRKIGGFERLVAYQHSDSLKARTQFNPNIPAYMLNKGRVMMEFIEAIQKGHVRFPNWEEFEPHYKEFTNVAIEYDEIRGKRKFTKIDTDDGFHAALFCWMVAQLVRNLT